jgi:hypothetical protein
MLTRNLLILVACEESQAVTIELRNRGHEAYSCDLEPCSGGHTEWHLQQDVTQLLKMKWDMLIAFPPCTYMSRAGARWMYAGGVLQEDRLAKEFFMMFYNAECPMIAIENPTPLKIVGLPPPTQSIQPYQFGHPYSKKTNLWLKGLPPLKPTRELTEHIPYLPSNVGLGRRKGQAYSKGVTHDAKIASKTFPGVARAMADQWTPNLLRPQAVSSDSAYQSCAIPLQV